MAERAEYSVELVGGEEQIARIARIFENNGNPKSLTHLKWQYQSAPAGEAITAFAVSASGEDAAVYSVFPVKACAGDNEIVIAQSLDTLTDARHRGRGLFSILANEVFKACADRGIALVYGFPNSSSAPGFFGRLGWRKVGYPPFLLHVANLSFPVQKLLGLRLPRVTNALQRIRMRAASKRFSASREHTKIVASADFCDPQCRELCNRLMSRIDLGVVRDPEYLLWRYSRPDAGYAAYSAWENGQLRGVIVYRLADKHGGNIGYIMDLLVDPEDPSLAKELLRQATLSLYDRHVDVVLAWSDSTSLFSRVFRSTGFSVLPRKFQPIKLFFGIKELSNVSSLALAEGMYMSYADSDTV